MRFTSEFEKLSPKLNKFINSERFRELNQRKNICKIITNYARKPEGFRAAEHLRPSGQITNYELQI